MEAAETGHRSMTGYRTKQIAIVDPVGRKAGMDCYDVALARCLNQGGQRIHIFSNFKPCEGDIVHTISFHNVIPNRYSGYAATLAGLWRSFRLCKQCRYEYVIVHFFKGGMADMLSALLARRFGLKTLCIVHDVTPVDGTRWLPFGKVILRMYRQGLLVHNKYSLRKLEELIGKKHTKNARIIPHIGFTNLAAASETNVPANCEMPPPGVRFLLFFGQIKKSKGLEILIKAMAIANPAWHLVIAGRSRDGSLSSCLRMVERLRLEERTHVNNRFINDAGRELLFGNATAVVLPYKMAFQSGVMVTAMSRGKLVVASDIEPHREIIAHGVNGLLFKSEDENSLADVLNSINDPLPWLKKMEKEAYRTMHEKHGCRTVNILYNSFLMP